MRWPKYWSFSFSIIPSKEIPGLIFRMDWLDLPAVQGTLKSLLQHHSSKASILRCSDFFTVHSTSIRDHWKNHSLDWQTFVGKVMSLLFNMLSRLVITFLPRSKDSNAGRDWGQEEKGMTGDEMAGWHHWLDGREFEWILGVSDGQGGLECCDSWGCKESDTTEQLNWTELNWTFNRQMGWKIRSYNS